MSLGVTITSAGIQVPLYPDVLAFLTAQYQSIYGSDANLDPDTQDGQWIGVVARAINDCNQGALAAYLARSPTTALGTGLSSIVKINGIARLIPTASTVPLVIVGQANTVINNGVVGDSLNLGTRWSLPPVVTIPVGGTITVTATSQALGAVAAAIGSLTKILTPTNGWQTVNNTVVATVGAPVESDASLRQRQSQSTAQPALTIQEGIFAAVASVPGVARLALYDNDTGAPDSNGVPGHSFAVVVQGGAAAAIAAAIAAKKAPGSGTFGTTTVVVTDSHGVTNTINFFVFTPVVITVTLSVKALAGYVSTTTPLIASAIANFINGLTIGEVSYLSRLFAPAALNGAAAQAATGLTQAQLDVLSATYNVTSGTMKQSRPSTAPPSVQDVPIAFNEGAVCTSANVTVTVT